MSRRVTYVYQHWLRNCGYCGRLACVATDGKLLFCYACGKW